MTIVLVSSLTGLCILAVVVLIRGQGPPNTVFAIYASGAGILFAGAIAAFYRALAIGQMGRVAPIMAVAPAIPVTYGLLRGERPGVLQATGIALILIGVTLAALERHGNAPQRRRFGTGIGLALVASGCFGVGIIGLDQASKSDPFWAALVLRAATTATVVFAVALTAQFERAPRSTLPGLWLIGLLDATGVCLFAVAADHLPVAVVATTGGLVPAVIVVLARVILHERLERIQYLGGAAALLGVVLVSAW